MNHLCEQVRLQTDRNLQPSAAIIGSQTVKTTEQGGDRGYDGHKKKIKGRKRHIAVDVLGLLICIIVQSANIFDRNVAKGLIEKALQICSTIQLFWADGGYTGKLIEWVKTTFQRILEIVLRPRGAFKIVQWRWIVERTFGCAQSLSSLKQSL